MWWWVAQTNNHYHSSLSWVELSRIESRLDQLVFFINKLLHTRRRHFLPKFKIFHKTNWNLKGLLPNDYRFNLKVGFRWVRTMLLLYPRNTKELGQNINTDYFLNFGKMCPILVCCTLLINKMSLGACNCSQLSLDWILI